MLKSVKWLIASDLHGSLTYCRELIRVFREEKADKMLLLGDLLYHGPRNDLPEGYAPKEVLALLNAHKKEILCVRGNCDTEVDQMVLEFPILADYAIVWEKGRMIYATHGHRWNEASLPPLHDGDILLNGHTHVCACREGDTCVYMNPGSVAIPKAGTPHAYMTLEDGLFLWKDFEGRIFDSYQI